MEIKLVTFNIRCDYFQDGKNSFEYRKQLIEDKIRGEIPDIICFQEVLPHVAVWLREVLTEYYVVGCGRGADLEDEQLTIAFKKDLFSLIHMDTFWLSPTPYIPGSRYGEQSDCPRVCTELLLMHVPEKKVFRLLNLHLDHSSVSARILGLNQVLKKVKHAKLYPAAPIILAGDFNAEQDGEEMKCFESYPEYCNVTKGIGVTYHGFLEDDEPEGIDNILITEPFLCKDVEKWKDCKDGIWLSDHYPISTKLLWE